MAKQHAMDVFGVPIDDYTTSEFISRLEELVDRPEQALVCPVNADILNQCYTNLWLRSFIASADMVQAESAGILLAAKLKGVAFSGKITSNEVIYDLAEAWEGKHFSIYFLGGPEGQAEAASVKLKQRFPGFKIAGFHRGHLNAAETDAVIAEINDLRPSILMVGFGCPAQEVWLGEHRSSLNVPLVWPIGNITSFIAGTVKTAPMWMKRNGLEWLYRLYLEPRRMWRRYVLGNPLFVFRVLWSDAFQKFLKK